MTANLVDETSTTVNDKDTTQRQFAHLNLLWKIDGVHFLQVRPQGPIASLPAEDNCAVELLHETMVVIGGTPISRRFVEGRVTLL